MLNMFILFVSKLLQWKCHLILDPIRNNLERKKTLKSLKITLV
uniref:Uncharacterized protein n=1 Tax=Anguilla anguilla TaxID=7936 RepID=A0A0E9VBZ2_ANGAN